ncbi:helix-turn-helix domain-containing protein [Emticicia fluvialis]|uniref:helix-turn-helix domain-containing protein n=1 Tax=Emticicia fluvialis TaxID=2974474 RepID=UPI00216592FF|nr:AraC family transcriptional regulator [Emticicia fluvialis]
MVFNFNPKSTLLFVFFFHGLVYTVLLLLKGLLKENKSNIWLSALVFLSTLYIVPFMCGYAGWYGRNPYREFLFYFPFQQLFLLPPVLYFYTKSLLDTSFSFSKKDYLHFLPALLYVAYTVFIWLVDKVMLKNNYFHQDGRDKDFAGWYQALGFLSMFFYLTLSLSVYNLYKSLTYQTVSFADKILFAWVKQFLSAMLILVVLRALFFVLNPEWNNFGNKFWYYICFSILFYYISISGYSNYFQSVIGLNHSNLFYEGQDDTQQQNATEGPDTKAQLNAVDIKEFELLKTEIERAMIIDHLFKNPELTLTDLANHLGMQSKRVSQIINQGFGLNFNDFVNHYRTQEVIRILQSDKPSLITLLGIALDSGFNSKSTFNRAFKKYTSLTPKAYLEKIKQQNGIKS